jgi:flagellar hook assembly protein FlgD
VTLTIYNAQGQSVRRLKDAVEPAGSYVIVWDGKDDRGQTLASGLYFYRLQTVYGGLTRRLVLLK